MSVQATVHFLPMEKKKLFARWLDGIGAAAHIKPRDYTALKIHFGEKGNKGFIEPAMARIVAEKVKAAGGWPFLTDANTIYVGERADAVHHATVAGEHGFTLDGCGCPVIIADGLRGNSGVDVHVGLKHFSHVSIANAIHYSDSLVFMSHFKGHEISGFGGALKNIGMGCGTRAGKYAMHDKLTPRVDVKQCIGCGQCVKWCGGHALRLENKTIIFDEKKCTGCGECILSCPSGVFEIPWDENTSAAQEKIVEYAFGVIKNKPHFSINFLNHITKFCDCYATKGSPLIGDIGILASPDPVALDQASADMVNKKFGGDFWRHIFPSIDWAVQLACAEELGLGTRKYKIVEMQL